MRTVIGLLVLALLLSACSGSAARSSYNCGEGVCTQLQVVDAVRPHQPVTVIITVSSDKDIPGLGLSLYVDADAEVEGPQGWESDVKDGKVYKGGASWTIPIRGNLTRQFTRKVRLPSREGVVQLVATASVPAKGPLATDSVRILLGPSGGTVYLPGTSIPATPGPLATLAPGSLPTPVSSPALPSPTLISTPTPKPYP